jgi:hypothetical protein
MVGDYTPPPTHAMPVAHGAIEAQNCWLPYEPYRPELIWKPPLPPPWPQPIQWHWYPSTVWPKVKRIEYHENGTIKSIEYYE